MSNAAVYSSLKKISSAYRATLHDIPDADFQLTPSIGGWSYSEVYCHIFDSSLLSLIALQNCIIGKGKHKPTALAVKLILLYGSLPPMIKYKVPKFLEPRVIKISKEKAEEFIGRFMIQLEANYKTIDHADPNIKNKHPRLGYLNADQWLRFIEIHLKHHLKQLKRIEKSF